MFGCAHGWLVCFARGFDCRQREDIRTHDTFVTLVHLPCFFFHLRVCRLAAGRVVCAWALSSLCLVLVWMEVYRSG